MYTKPLDSLKKDLAERNSEALQELFLAFRQDCIRILISKQICKPDQAEPLYTDSILLMRKNILSGKMTDLSNPVSYLVSVCRNILRNEQRQEAKKRSKAEQVRLLFYENGYDSVEEIDEKEQRIRNCKEALLTLSERCQQILTAYYVHGMRMKEIASELELSSSDVAKTLKSRCYKSWMSQVKVLQK